MEPAALFAAFGFPEIGLVRDLETKVAAMNTAFDPLPDGDLRNPAYRARTTMISENTPEVDESSIATSRFVRRYVTGVIAFIIAILMFCAAFS